LFNRKIYVIIEEVRKSGDSKKFSANAEARGIHSK